MDVRVLRYFVAIAQEQNISRAADQLHVSQPALSRQIADLETELGTQLFTRAHRHIQLTQEGYYLLQRAQEIIGLVDKTTYNLQKQDVISGTLDIGAGESVGLRPIMQTVQEVIQKYPEVRVNLRSGDAADILPKLDAGVLEFGVIMGHRQFNNYNMLVLPDDNRWGIIMRKDEKLAEKSSISPSDLLGRSILISAQAQKNGPFQNWSSGLFDQFHVIGSSNLIFNASLLVETGAGMALTYEHLVDTSVDSNLVFRPLNPELTEPNTLIWSKNRSLPNVSQLFLDKLQDNISK